MSRSLLWANAICAMLLSLHQGQAHTLLLAAADGELISGSTDRIVIAERGDDRENTFSSDSIPYAGIPVLENSLGDVVHDSLLNIIDVLRLRDIIIGRQPPASPYERIEGDLSLDGTLGDNDLMMLRSILLHTTDVPYLVGHAGGEVLGDGIRLTIPPGALDTTSVFSIRRMSESAFASELGVDTRAALEDSAYFMAGFEITSSIIDFRLPLDAEVKLTDVPPCAYQGLNGLFAGIPDKDGDGRSELVLINELRLGTDSLTLTTDPIYVPFIQSVSASAVEPGAPVLITGSGFGDDLQNAVVRFVSAAHPDSLQNVLPSLISDSTILLTAPMSPRGLCEMSIQHLSTGLTSNVQSIDILPPTPPGEDTRLTILGFYAAIGESLDSLSVDSLFAFIEDTTVRHHLIAQYADNRTAADSELTYFTALPDSLIPEYSFLASYIHNINLGVAVEAEMRYRLTGYLEGCDECNPYEKALANTKKLTDALIQQYNHDAAMCLERKPFGICAPCDRAEQYRRRVLELTDALASIMNALTDCWCRLCPPEAGCKKCGRSTYIGYGPKGEQISGGFDNNGFHVKGTCINIIRYKRNECARILRPIGANGSPVPVHQLPELKCPSAPPLSQAHPSDAAEIDTRPHPGSLVKITNAPVPYNIVSLMNENGNAFIPHVPLSTTITFAMYDPVTGFYDPDVGTYTTGPTPGGFDRPLLLFKPTTETRRIAMHIGEIKHDSVSLDYQRIDYVLNVTASDTGRMINVGFESNALLSLRFEDPHGNILMDNNSTECYFYPRIRLNDVGAYVLRVSYAISGQAGAFTVGVAYYPYPPTGAYFTLCGGFVLDTLYEELSPYVVRDPLAIGVGDTVVVEAGVELLFDHGGSVMSNGTLRGSGTSAKPIKLQQAGATNRELITIKKGESGRKEDKP